MDNSSPEVKNEWKQVTCSSGREKKIMSHYFNAKNEVDFDQTRLRSLALTGLTSLVLTRLTSLALTGLTSF